MPVTDWSSVVLSNAASLLTWERELSNLCGVRTNTYLRAWIRVMSIQFAIITDSYPSGVTVVNGEIKYFSFTTNDGNKYNINATRELISIPLWVENMAKVVKRIDVTYNLTVEGLVKEFAGYVDLTLTDNISKLVFNVPIRNQESKYLPYNIATLCTLEAMSWTSETLGSNWNDKIANAKKIVGLDLEKKLRDKNISVDEANGKVLLNVIANPTNFSVASDYKAIQLIYEDLSESSLSAELYSKKALSYSEKYRDELYAAWLRVNLDLSLTGTVDEYRADLIGELER
jgi:hypothetical protein